VNGAGGKGIKGFSPERGSNVECWCPASVQISNLNKALLASPLASTCLFSVGPPFPCSFVTLGPAPSPGNLSEMQCFSWVLVAHACNPSHSGGRDQEDCNWKPSRSQPWANSLQDPVSKKPFTQKG
jgi:hypothetical protein